MQYTSKNFRKLLNKIRNDTATDTERERFKKILQMQKNSQSPEKLFDKNLSVYSGMKGVEKSQKDKIGKSLNLLKRNDAYDKLMKRINNNDS